MIHPAKIDRTGARVLANGTNATKIRVPEMVTRLFMILVGVSPGIRAAVTLMGFSTNSINGLCG